MNATQKEANFYKTAYYDLQEAVLALERLYTTYGDNWSSPDVVLAESLLEDTDQVIKKVWNFENEKRLCTWRKLSELAQRYFRFIAQEKVIAIDELAVALLDDRKFVKTLALDELTKSGLVVAIENYLCLTADGQTVRQALLDREEIF